MKSKHDCHDFGVRLPLDERYLKCSQCGHVFRKVETAKNKQGKKGPKPCQAQMFS